METAVAAPFSEFAWYFFIIRASDVVLMIFDILDYRPAAVKGGPRHSLKEPRVDRKSLPYIKNWEDHITSPYNKEVPYKFWCQSDE